MKVWAWIQLPSQNLTGTGWKLGGSVPVAAFIGGDSRARGETSACTTFPRSSPGGAVIKQVVVRGSGLDALCRCA